MSTERSRPNDASERTRAETRRPHRVVTFVTDSELKRLRALASADERSVSSIVHRLIAAQLRALGTRTPAATENDEPVPGSALAGTSPKARPEERPCRTR